MRRADELAGVFEVHLLCFLGKCLIVVGDCCGKSPKLFSKHPFNTLILIGKKVKFNGIVCAFVIE